MSSTTSNSHISYSHNETSFPAEKSVRGNSTVYSERMGAFGEMRHTPSSTTPTGKLRVDMNSSNSNRSPTTETPILPSSSLSMQPPQHNFQRDSQSSSSNRSQPLRVNMSDSSNRSSANSQRPLLGPNDYSRPFKAPVRFEKNPVDTTRTEMIYMPTVSNSQADSSESRRRHEKLAEVYSQSGDTVEFAKNLSDYINDRIPYQISIAVLTCFSLLAFLLIIFGTLNIPFCAIQPMIPIWLIVEGSLFIISATFRIYFLIPTPRRTIHRRRQRKLGGNLLCKGLELLFLLANIVWLILGCVWTFGSRTYVHFEEGMFERHYCEPTVYWAAFIACTTFLIFYSAIIFILICLLVVGSCKETTNEDQILD